MIAPCRIGFLTTWRLKQKIVPHARFAFTTLFMYPLVQSTAAENRSMGQWLCAEHHAKSWHAGFGENLKRDGTRVPLTGNSINSIRTVASFWMAAVLFFHTGPLTLNHSIALAWVGWWFPFRSVLWPHRAAVRL
jgi:hypothetical protein